MFRTFLSQHLWGNFHARFNVNVLCDWSKLHGCVYLLGKQPCSIFTSLCSVQGRRVHQIVRTLVFPSESRCCQSGLCMLTLFSYKLKSHGLLQLRNWQRNNLVFLTRHYQQSYMTVRRLSSWLWLVVSELEMCISADGSRTTGRRQRSFTVFIYYLPLIILSWQFNK